jgi:hypothetical protein
MVPVIRWRGFKINVEGMKTLLAKAQAVVKASPVNINKPKDVRAYLMACMDDTEKLVRKSRRQPTRRTWRSSPRSKSPCKTCGAMMKRMMQEEDLALGIPSVKEPEHCTKCDGAGKHELGFCHRCAGRGHMVVGEHPAATRAKEILGVKTAAKEVELYAKLIKAGKFHASFNVVGTLSSRMSGGDGLNAQGIKAADEVRCMFPLAWDGYELCGGDFDSFEVTLADAVYKCDRLHAALITKVPCHECGATGKVKPKCESCAALKKARRNCPRNASRAPRWRS